MIVNADSIRIPLEDRSVHCVVTSPPYWGLRSYLDADDPLKALELGAEPIHDCLGWARGDNCGECYVCKMRVVFSEIWRVLRDDGTAWLNLGDSYASTSKGSFYDAQFALQDSGIKPKDLTGIPWRVALALQADGWYLRSDIIWAKCLSGGTKVYARTQKGDGPNMIKDLQRLDPSTVQLWNGEQWTKVKGFYETPRPDNPIELVLRSGERIGCTPDHRWPTQRGLLRADDLQIGDVLDYTALPEPEDVVTPDRLPDSIGWFIGIYLAEGSRDSSGTIQISSHLSEERRFDMLKILAGMYGGTCNKYQTSESGMAICIHSTVLSAILDMYLSGRIAKNKRLSPVSWKRSNRFLKNVLIGYLEGDGHYDESNDRYRIGFTRNYYLEQDLRTICARLDYQIRLKPVTMKSQNGTHPGFRGEIRFKRSDHWNAKHDTEIVEIRRSRARKFWDIEVDGDSHLFALSSGVLTHNSNPMPESVTDRPTKAHEYLFLLAKSRRYFYDHEAVKEPITESSKERAKYGWSGQTGEAMVVGAISGSSFKRMKKTGALMGDLYGSTRNRRTVWTISTKPFRGAHFAVFSPDLVAPCILAGTSAEGVCQECGAPWERVVEKERPPDDCYVGTSKPENIRAVWKTGGMGQKLQNWYNEHPAQTTGWRPTCDHDAERVPAIVLDPFCGSGTVGLVCRETGRDFVGLDLNPTYLREFALPRAERKQTTESIQELPLFGRVDQ